MPRLRKQNEKHEAKVVASEHEHATPKGWTWNGETILFLAAIVHHYGAGEMRVTKAFLEDTAPRIDITAEDDGDGFTLRTKLNPPAKDDEAAA